MHRFSTVVAVRRKWLISQNVRSRKKNILFTQTPRIRAIRWWISTLRNSARQKIYYRLKSSECAYSFVFSFIISNQVTYSWYLFITYPPIKRIRRWFEKELTYAVFLHVRSPTPLSTWFRIRSIWSIPFEIYFVFWPLRWCLCAGALWSFISRIPIQSLELFLHWMEFYQITLWLKLKRLFGWMNEMIKYVVHFLFWFMYLIRFNWIKRDSFSFRH